MARLVRRSELAIVPDGVSLTAAAALPVAGVTALQAVQRLGSILGKRVLITGASGGVGRYAVQLANLAGAHVIASVGSAERAEGLLDLGASEIVLGPAAITKPLDGVVDNVGGQQLAAAYQRLAPDGVVIAVGMSSDEPTTIDFEAARTAHDRGRIETFNISVPLGDDLRYLVQLVTARRLITPIGWQDSWFSYEDAIDRLLGRQTLGKAVLQVPV